MRRHTVLGLSLKNTVLLVLVAACVAVTGRPSPCEAATYRWFGNGGSNDWGNFGNWQNAAVPPTAQSSGTTTKVAMQGSGGNSDLASAANVDLDFEVDSLTFESQATGAYTMLGGKLILTNTFDHGSTKIIRNNDGNTHTFNNDGVEIFDQTILFDAVSGDLDFSTDVNFGINNATLTTSGGQHVYFNDGLTGDAFVSSAALSIGGGTTAHIGGSSGILTNVTISDGTLQIDSNSNLGNDVDISTFSGTTFNVNGFTENINTITGSGTVSLGSGALTFGDSSNFTFSGSITGTGSLSKDKDGITTLSGNNTYSGATSVGDGTLRLSGSGRLSNSTDLSVSSGATFDLNGLTDTVDSVSGAGTILLGGGELTVDATSGGEVFSGNIQESGTLRKSGNHTLTLSGNNSFSSLIVAGGDVAVSSSSNLGASNATLLLGGGTLDVTGSFTNSRQTFLQNGTVDVFSGSTLTQSGVIQNNTTTASLTKKGAGTLVLSGNNSYTGDTIVDAGRVEISGSSERINNSSDLIMNAGTFDLNNRTETVGGLSGTIGGFVETGGSSGRLIVNQSENRTFSGAVSGSGGLTKQGTGRLTLAGTNTYDGSTLVQDGTLQFASGGTLDSTTDVSVSSGATLDMNGVSDTFDSISGAGSILLGGASVNVDQSSGTTTFSGTISESGGISKSGGHKLILSGNNSFTGGVLVFDGAISVGADNNMGAASGPITLAASGTLETTGSFTTARTLQFGQAANGTIDTASGTTLTHTGAISGGSDVTLHKAGGGTYTLGAANSGFSGDIVVEAGTFEIGSFSGNALGNSTRITVNNGATLLNNQVEGFGSLAGSGSLETNATFEVGFDNSSTTYSGVISGDVGSGFVGKNGSGTMTITRPQTYSGHTQVNAGTLRLSGSGSLPNASDVLVAGTWDLNNVSDVVDGLTGPGSVLLGSGTLTLGGNNGLGNFAGVISETGALVKIGSGRQQLSGNNLYTGSTSIEGGMLEITSSNNLGSGPLIFKNGARLQSLGTTTNSRSATLNVGGGVIGVNSGQTFTQSGIVQGAAGLGKAATGTLVLAANNTYGGPTDITAGTLRLSGAGRIPNSSDVAISSGATFDLNGVSDLVRTVAGAGDIQLGGAILTVVGNDTSTYTLFGIISESGALIKDGRHTQVLSGINTFVGPVSVLDGILSVSSNSNLGNAANSLMLDQGTISATESFTMPRPISVSNNGGTIDVSTNFLTVNQAISGAGQLTKTGVGNLSLSGNNTYSGGTLIQDGLVEVFANSGLGANTGAVTLASGSLYATGDFTNLHPIVVSGNGIVDVDGGFTLTHDEAITGIGNLEKRGDGTLVLSVPATHTGDTEINGGTLQFGAGGLPDLFDVSINGAVWDLNGTDDTIDALFVDGTVLLGGATLTLGAADGGSVVEGSIEGPGELVKIGAGEQGLEGPNTHASTDINGGSLRTAFDAALGAAGAPIGFDGGALHTYASFAIPRDVTLNPLGGTFNVDGNTTLTVANPVTGPGGLTKIGEGTLILQAASNFGGPMSVLDGLLQIDTGMTFGGLSGDGDIEIGLNELILNNTGDDIYGGVISGIGGKLTKDGPGTVTLTGINTYTGGTCILDGVLRISQSENLGALGSLITFDGGTLNTTDSFSMIRGIALNAGGGTIDVDAGTLLDESGNITGVGSLTKIGDGTLQLSGFSSYEGGTNILGGEVSINSNINLGNTAGQLTLDNGSLHASNSVNMARPTTVGAGGGTFRTDGSATLTHSGAISGNPGAAGVTKSGAGNLRWQGNNTFAGDVVLQAGRLQVDATGQLGDASNILRLRGGTLNTLADMTNNRAIQLEDGLTPNTIETATGSTFTQSGVISDGTVGPPQTLAKSGSGTLTLTAANTYSSPTQINAGTVRLTGSGQLPDVTDVTVATGSTFDLNGVDDTIDALAGDGDVTLGSGTLTAGADNGDGTFTGVISGSGGLVKVGSGTQLLRTHVDGEDMLPNTYAGGTAINGGVLNVENDGNLGDPMGPLSFDGGTLRSVEGANGGGVNSGRLVTLNTGGGTINADDESSVRFNNVITGIGSMTKEGLGVLTYGASNTYTGDTIVNRGDLRLEANGRISDLSNLIVNAPGIFDLNNINDAVNGLSGNGDIMLGTGRLTVGTAGGDGDHSGVISGVGGITKAGAGTQQLRGVNTYSGATNVNGGVLQVALDANLGDASGALNFDGGTLLTSGSFNIGRNPTLNAGGGMIDTVDGTTLNAIAPFSGVGGLTKLGSGTLQLGAVSTYTGATNINNGTLLLDGTERLDNATDVTVAVGAILNLANFNESVDALSGAGTVALGSASLNVGIDNGSGIFSGAITGTGDLLKEGTGTQTLTGVNTYNGATFVDRGQLILAAGGQIDQSTTVVGFNIGADGIATADGSGTTWDLTGDLFVGLDGRGRMNIRSGAVMTVEGAITVGSNNQGPASAGILSLDGGTLDNTGGNGISVINGSLQGDGTVIANVNNFSTVAPGNSAGILDITGDYVQALGATLAIEVGGNDNSGDPQFDVLHVSGNLGLDGLLDLALLSGFTPSPADTFSVATANILAGAFSNVASGARLDISSGGTGSFQVDYDANAIVLSDFQGMGSAGGDFDGNGMLDGRDIDGLVAVIAAGSNDPAFDLTGDALVDGADLTEWLAIGGAANLASGNPYLVGDATLDGVVDGLDFIAWNANKFTGLPAWTGGDFTADGIVDGLDFIAWNANKFTSSGDSIASVPEPGVWSLLIFALGGMWLLTPSRNC